MVSPVQTTTSKDKTSNPFQLKTTDFINMMVTQLQNQDPLSPTSNQDLLAQMSQIGQLQSQTSLTTTLQSLGLQTSLSASGNLIGKMVLGQDTDGSPIQGLVSSVRVESGNVSLELDNGKELPLDKVTTIAPAPAPAVAAGPVKPS